MKRWQLELMGVMLLTLALVFFVGRGAILPASILWVAGRATIVRAAGERPIKAAFRFVIAGLAAVGCLVSIQYTQSLRFLTDMPQVLIEKGPIPFVAFSSLLVYWLEDAYALVPLEGMARTILRGIVSLILASFAAIGFAVAYAVGCYLVHPVEGPIYFGLMAWVLLFMGFAVPFCVAWKLLTQRDHPYTAGL
jgi:hypothetical protein